MLNAFDIKPDDWTAEQLGDFLALRMPMAETLHWLHYLTPENTSPALFQRFLNAMRSQAEDLAELSSIQGKAVIDCCGTGGSGLPRFNTSTAIAFVLAAGGLPVVKFGNRATTSQSGSFDLLHAMGIPAQWRLSQLPDLMDDCGLVFLYAPQIYPNLAAFSAIRKRIGVRTIFNAMGPLLNPANPAYQLMGVSDGTGQKLLAQALHKEGTTRSAWVVRGENGLDDIIPHGQTRVLSVTPQAIEEKMLNFQWAECAERQVQYTANANFEILMNIVSGTDSLSDSYRSICLNAGAGLYIAGKANTMDDGIVLAETLIRDGAVDAQIKKCRRAYAQAAQ